MGEILYYNDRNKKRNEFKESLRVDTSRRINRRTPQQERNYRRLQREADLYYSLPEKEKIWIQNRRLKLAESRRYKEGEIKGYRVPEEHKKYRGRKRAMTIAMILGIVGAISIGGHQLYENYTNSQNQNRTEEISQNIDALEQSGLNQETIAEIQSLQTELTDQEIENLNDEELLSLGERVESVQMDTLKEKLAKALGVSEENITLAPNYSWSANEQSTASIIVTRDGEETIYNTGDFLDWNNNISNEIRDGILNLGNTQTVNSMVRSGEFDRAEAIEQYRSGVDSASEIALKQMNIDENGNISLEEMDTLIQNDEEER